VGSNTSAQAIYTSAFLPGLTFELSQMPALPAGEYTLTAEGMNLAGAVSPPVSMSFYMTATTLSAVRVYPDPWRSDQDSAYPIKFDQMPPGSTLKIFTVSGHWVQTLTADSTGLVSWNRENSSGQQVQSGLYLFLVTDSQGNKMHGKFAIIR
jgi:hypothetical protein